MAQGERSVSALTRGTRTARWLKRSCVGLGTLSGAILSSTRCSIHGSARDSTRSGSKIAPKAKHAGRWHRQLEPDNDAACSDLGARLPWTDDEVKASPMNGKGPPAAGLAFVLARAVTLFHSVAFTPLSSSRCRKQRQQSLTLCEPPEVQLQGPFSSLPREYTETRLADAVAAGPPRVCVRSAGSCRAEHLAIGSADT